MQCGTQEDIYYQSNKFLFVLFHLQFWQSIAIPDEIDVFSEVQN